MSLTTILLAVIVYFLWKMYRQKEDEKIVAHNTKIDAEWEEKKKEEFKDYPHLIGKIDYSWLELFGRLYINHEGSHLNQAFMMYLREANNTKLDMFEVDELFNCMWDLTEELIEHLEKYHESTKFENEIAIITYWQNLPNGEEVFVGKDIDTIKKLFQSSPFTDIEKIPMWFPRKDNHPNKELSFRDENGNFPRESKGSEIVHKRITV